MGVWLRRAEASRSADEWKKTCARSRAEEATLEAGARRKSPIAVRASAETSMMESGRLPSVLGPPKSDTRSARSLDLPPQIDTPFALEPQCGLNDLLASRLYVGAARLAEDLEIVLDELCGAGREAAEHGIHHLG